MVFWTISRNERTVRSERIFGDILLGLIFAINDGEDGFNNHYAIVRHGQTIREKTKNELNMVCERSYCRDETVEHDTYLCLASVSYSLSQPFFSDCYELPLRPIHLSHIIPLVLNYLVLAFATTIEHPLQFNVLTRLHSPNVSPQYSGVRDVITMNACNHTIRRPIYPLQHLISYMLGFKQLILAKDGMLLFGYTLPCSSFMPQ